jgi:hypothetical protein
MHTVQVLAQRLSTRGFPSTSERLVRWPFPVEVSGPNEKGTGVVDFGTKKLWDVTVDSDPAEE